jgi:hypothetical protein
MVSLIRELADRERFVVRSPANSLARSGDCAAYLH